MGRKLLALLVFVQSLSSGSWSVGIGGGSSHYLARQYPSSYRFEDLSAIETGWRVEAEAGYYAGREGFNIMAVYGETFWRSQSRQTLFRDQHLGLLGEYRLFVLNQEGTLQGAVGLGPSLRRFSYYIQEEKAHYPFRFNIDAGIAGLFFSTRHLLLRAQATYSFPPLNPGTGVVGLTLRAAYRM
ncbi:MAG: hypothetical protein U9Q76_06340 [candidate division WOR-3 bacterium]|nr:hypothetical protein [candidate division WOR-3 bacterium]